MKKQLGENVQRVRPVPVFCRHGTARHGFKNNFCRRGTARILNFRRGTARHGLKFFTPFYSLLGYFRRFLTIKCKKITFLPIFCSFKAILNVILLWNLPVPGRATRAGTVLKFSVSARHGAARISKIFSRHGTDFNFFIGTARHRRTLILTNC